MPRVKRLAAPHLSNSWNTIPHVTHHDEADITELENFRTKLIDSVSGRFKKAQIAVAPTNKVNQIEKIRVNLISEIKRSLFLNIKLN